MNNILKILRRKNKCVVWIFNKILWSSLILDDCACQHRLYQLTIILEIIPLWI